MILPIYTEPQAVLHQVCAPVTVFDQELRNLVNNMRESMHNAQGLGLAAPQVGVLQAVCVIEFNSDDPEDDQMPFLPLINPRITWKSHKLVTFVEGCLSLPGIEAPIQRPDRIRLKAQDLEGKLFQMEADGLLARVIQHELDHLQGILFTSYVPKKALLKRKTTVYPQI